MDGESCDYATELATFFLSEGCLVPDPIKTSVNDFPGFLVITTHGKEDPGTVETLVSVLGAAGIPVRVEAVKENSIGTWYQDAVHVIVGRKAP